MNNLDLKNKIKIGLEKIKSSEQKDWITERLIEPYLEKLALDQNGEKYSEFWIVTKHKLDKCYRIAYNQEVDMFGIVTLLDNNIEWFMGYYGTFDETINSL